MKHSTNRTVYSGKTAKHLPELLKEAISGILVLIAGVAVLCWNEGNGAQTRRDIREVRNAVKVVGNEVSTINLALNGKNIYACAPAVTGHILHDTLFGVSTNAVRLLRQVAYYQWTEKEHHTLLDKITGAEELLTTHTYEKEWVHEPVASDRFWNPDYRNGNFTLTLIENRHQTAPDATFGAYILPEFIKHVIPGAMPVTVAMTADRIRHLKDFIAQNTDSLTEEMMEKECLIHVLGNTVHIGRSPGSPQIGDVRITFRQFPSGDTVSLIAKVKYATFEPCITADGRAFARVKPGVVSPDDLLGIENEAPVPQRWLWHLLGVALVAGSIFMLRTPCRRLAHMKPL
jgi:hypothetical protein